MLAHAHVLRDDFRERGLFEVIQADPKRQAIAGLYMLKERRGEERVEEMIVRIEKAAKATLPPL